MQSDQDSRVVHRNLTVQQRPCKHIDMVKESQKVLGGFGMSRMWSAWTSRQTCRLLSVEMDAEPHDVWELALRLEVQQVPCHLRRAEVPPFDILRGLVDWHILLAGVRRAAGLVLLAGA